MLVGVFRPGKPIHIELAHKGGHVVVLEVEGEGSFGELGDSDDLEASSVRSPSDNFPVCRVLK